MNQDLCTTETKLRFWPTPQDYCEAMQNPRVSFDSESLRNAEPELDALGLPRPISGGFASVYQFRGKDEKWAVRCFLSNRPDQQERYRKISEFIQSDSLPYTVDFEYLEKGIRISGNWFPILKMAWVEGDTLDRYVMKHWNNKAAMQNLCSSFAEMDAELRKHGIAHGDLQHGNILVLNDGQLRLVDYDGMFVPSMTGWLSIELGHANYQHPARNQKCFDNTLDNFSSLVLYASLKAISIDPQLVTNAEAMNECLLLRATDLREPTKSPVLQKLENHANTEIRHLSRLIRYYLQKHPSAVPPLNNLPTVLTAPLPSFDRPEPASQRDGNSASASTLAWNQADNVPWWHPNDVSRATTPISMATSPVTASGSNQSWSIEPELLKSSLRSTIYNQNQHRMAPIAKQALLCLLPPFWIFVLLPLVFYSTMTSVEGTVTSVSSPSQTIGSTYGTVNFTYVLGEKEWQGRQMLPSNSARLTEAARTGKIQVWGSRALPQYGYSADGAIPEPIPVFLMVISIIASVVVSILIWSTPVKHWKLASNGVPIRGKVTDKTVEQVEQGVPQYKVHYSYTANNILYIESMDVSKRDYNNISVGAELTVLFNPVNPSDSVLYRWSFFNAVT